MFDEGRKLGIEVVDVRIKRVDLPEDVSDSVFARMRSERERVARAGLLRVLTRVTGLKSVPRNDVVTEALAQPDRFYSEFVFFNRADTSGLERLHLKVVFQRDAVLTLVGEAQLPVWWNRRPQVLAWIVVEENLNTLKHLLPIPHLGFVPWLEQVTPEKAAQFLTVDPLLA